MIERLCGTCGSAWDRSFKFCPSDGSELVVIRRVGARVATLRPRASAQPARHLTGTIGYGRGGVARRLPGHWVNPIHKYYKARGPDAFVETADHQRPEGVDPFDPDAAPQPRTDSGGVNQTQRSFTLCAGGDGA